MMHACCLLLSQSAGSDASTATGDNDSVMKYLKSTSGIGSPNPVMKYANAKVYVIFVMYAYVIACFSYRKFI